MKRLDELLAEVLSEMTDEEFDMAWRRIKDLEKDLEDEDGASNPIL